MKESDWDLIKATLVILFIFFAGVFCGYVQGDLTGYREGIEATRKSECIASYGRRLLKDVPVGCVKYLTEK